MAKLAERITVDPEQCGGRPLHPWHADPGDRCARPPRQRPDCTAQVLEELPDLELEDIHACLRFASQRLNHPVVVA